MVANNDHRRPIGTTRRRDRSQQLIAIAADLFCQHGYHRVGVDDIAAVAGISGPAIYRHFASKQQLLASVLLSALDVLADTTAGIVADESTPPAERLATLAATMGRLSVQRRDITALWRWQSGHLDRAGRDRVREHGTALIARWVNLLRLARGELTAADADVLCLAALSVFGSIADYRPTLPKGRLAGLLAELSTVVFATSIPPRPKNAPKPHLIVHTEIAENKRDEILAAAIPLIRRRGYHAASIEEIGQAVGLAAPSVYRHFSSKEEILMTAGRKLANQLTEHADQAAAKFDSPKEILNSLLRYYVDNFSANTDLLAIYISEVVNLTGRHRDELVSLQRSHVAQWISALRAASPRLDEATARTVVHAALTVVNDLCRIRHVVGGAGFPDNVAHICWAILSSSMPD
ncbi:MAG: TetR/AcrR family transcriptional regulator [Sciscionella sp.]|nr:TetR/AcrR family transcriptional regulator [Sciscionella sp.]